MNSEISNFNSDISDSLTVYKKLVSDIDWKGSAANTFFANFDDLMNRFDKIIENIKKFVDALDLIDKIKVLDDEISRLRNSLISITAEMSEETKQQATSSNNYNNSLISTKWNEREELKKEAINLISDFSDSESDIIDLSSVDLTNAKVLFEYNGGSIYEIVASNGQKYEVYIPNHIDTSKPMIVYDAGDSGSGGINSTANWEMFKNYFSQNDYDYVVFHSLRRDNSFYYNDLCEKLNLEPDSRLFISHSGGTTYNFNEFIDLVEEDNSVPGVVAVMDGYTPGYWFRNTGVTQKLIDNKTIVFGFHVNTRNSYAIEYEKLAADGVNMLLLSDQSDLGHSHSGVNNTLIDNNVLQYLTGDGELPDNYVIKYYNPNEENADASGFVTVDHSQVKTLDDVYNFFGIER